MSVSFSRGRVSRLASSCPKDFNFEFFVYANEAVYSDAWSGRSFINWFRSLPDGTFWNCIICFVVYLGVVLVTLDLRSVFGEVEDIAYNVLYGVHVLAMFCEYHRLQSETIESTWLKKLGFVVDILSYIHFPSLLILNHFAHYKLKIVCYVVRFHRPLGYLWTLSDSNLKGSVVGTALKYIYIFFVLRIICAELYLNLDRYFDPKYYEKHHTEEQWAIHFLKCAYEVNNNFMPIGSSRIPETDYDRIKHLSVVLLGRLVVTGAAVASLSLVISLYMRPEEMFRSRFRLIMQDMKETHIRQELRDKVETFYKMYWHKKKAVSVTELLPIFPPTLPASIYTDIYFEAQQKSVILRDLSYQFLYEVARVMNTIHYIPGDAIIQRHSNKSNIIYITYGDIEMLTAEDNRTPILRMTRGTILSSCGAEVAIACGKSLVEIRAATFCIAHVLKISDLWKVAVKHGRQNGQAFIIHSSFEEHFEKVKQHYSERIPQPVKYKSSIVYFKRNLIALKEARDESGQLLLRRTDYFLEIAGCYLMRNRKDSFLTDESDTICLRSTFPCILQPQSSLLTVWQALVAFLICIITFTHPYNLVYLPEASYKFKFWDYMMTLVFTVDLMVHLSTGSNVEDGVPITLAHTSSQQLQNPWFVFDVLGTIPIFEFVGDGKFAGINKLLRMPKVFRVLRSVEEVCVYKGNVLRLASYSLLSLVLTCFIATVQQVYMCYNHNHCLVSNFTHAPFWSDGELDMETITDRVTYSLYWAICFTTFTAHWTQLVGIDQIYTIFYNFVMLEVITIVYLLIDAVYSATIMVTTSMRDEYDQCIENVKNFLIRNHVDPMLQHRFIQYLQLCWYTDMAYAITHEKQSIYFDLPSHVYQDIVARQCSKYILCLPFMQPQFINNEELKNVSSKATLFYTSPNEILLNTGDINNEIYIIKKGMCEVLDPDSKQVIVLIGQNKYFGVLECLMRFPAYYTVRAVTHVQVISISRKYLGNVIRVPKIKAALDYVRIQPEYNRIRRRRELFLEYEYPPPIPNRQRFPLPRKHIGDSAFMHPFQTLGFFSVLRYIFPRFTIRPDGKYMTRYEWFRSVCALLSAMFYPGYTYLVLQFPWLSYLVTCLDLTAYFDIIQRMLVGFYNDHGILVYHPASTAANYISGAFIVDLFASLPLENLEYRQWTHKDTRLLMAPEQYLMLNRLVQLYRLPGAMDILSNWIDRRDIILVIKSIPLFLAVINVLTCMVVYHSATIYALNDDTEWSIVPLADPGGSWMVLFDKYFRFNMTENPWNMHLSVYFWVVYETTTTGYTIFRPSNLSLLRIFFCGMLVSSMITTYITVSIISIRANVNKELASFQEHMKDIITFMRREKLDMDLQKEVKDFYAYNWEKRGGLDYRNVLKLCDQITLRTDAILYIYGPTFAKCPILFQCDMALLRVMGRAVHSEYFQRNTHIFEKDDVISDMYFLDYGKVNVIDNSFNVHSGAQLTKGSVFGNLDGMATYRCKTQLVAVTNIHILKINSMAFHKIVTDFPTVKVLMKKYRPQNETYILGHVRDGGFGSETSIMSWKERSVSNPFIYQSPRKGVWSYMVKKKRLGETFLVAICLLCIYGDIYNAAFVDNRMNLIIALYLLDLCFYLKILITFAMPMMVEEDETKNNLIDARKQYLKSDFRCDIASSLPIELLCLASKDKTWRLFSLLRLNRIFRVVTVDKCIKKHLMRLESNLTLTTILSVSIWFSMFIHATSCLWYAIGEIEDQRTPNSSWMRISEKYNCGSMYFCSAYFVLCTFMQNGMGDILPSKHSEVVFVILLQIISSLMYMVYVGEFSNIIQYQSFRSFGFYKQYLELQEFLKNNRVSYGLVQLIKRYALHLWRENRGLQVPHFLATAPQCFMLKVMSSAYLHHFLQHPAFNDCEHAFLRQLVGCLTLYTYCDDIFVVKDSEITDCMYLIHKGTVQELDEDMDENTHGQVFTAGEHFGMIQGLVRDTPFTYSYRTKTKSQVLTLHLDAWEYLLAHFPNSRYAIYKNIPGHPYSRPPHEAPPKPPPSPPKDELKKIALNAPRESEEHETFNKPADILDADAVEDNSWSVRRRVRRSTIVAPNNSMKFDSMTTLDETKETKLQEKLQGRKSIFHIPTVESDVMLPDMEADDNIQAAVSEPNIHPGKKSTMSLSTIKSATSGHLVSQHSQDLRPYMHGEEEHTREMSLTPTASETDLTKEEATRYRRKTIFQKIAETAKKIVSAEERKDVLLLEDDMAATNALIDKFEEDTDKFSTNNKQSKNGNSESDKNEDATSSRPPKLSFNPRQFKKDENNKAATERSTKTSKSLEPLQKDGDKDEYAVNRRLSFHSKDPENVDATFQLEEEDDDKSIVVGQKKQNKDVQSNVPVRSNDNVMDEGAGQSREKDYKNDDRLLGNNKKEAAQDGKDPVQIKGGENKLDAASSLSIEKGYKDNSDVVVQRRKEDKSDKDVITRPRERLEGNRDDKDAVLVQDHEISTIYVEEKYIEDEYKTPKQDTEEISVENKVSKREEDIYDIDKIPVVEKTSKLSLVAKEFEDRLKKKHLTAKDYSDDYEYTDEKAKKESEDLTAMEHKVEQSTSLESEYNEHDISEIKVKDIANDDKGKLEVKEQKSTAIVDIESGHISADDAFIPLQQTSPSASPTEKKGDKMKSKLDASVTSAAGSSTEVDSSLWPLRKRPRLGKSTESGRSLTETKSQPKEGKLEEMVKKTDDDNGLPKEESRKIVSSTPVKIRDSKTELSTGPFTGDNSPALETDINLWPMHKRVKAGKPIDQEIVEIKSDEKVESLLDDAKVPKPSASQLSAEEREEESNDNNKMQQMRTSRKAKLMITEPETKDEEYEDYELIKIHSHQDVEEYLGETTKASSKSKDSNDTSGITSALRTDRISRIGRVRIDASDDSELQLLVPDESEQPSTSRQTESKKSPSATDKEPR